MSTLTGLGAAKYVLLTTFRKDGRAVPTPLWAVVDGDGLAVWTPVDSGKVKRIRRNSRVTVAPCTFGGTPTGETVEARARVGDRADTDRVRDALGRKYGLSGRLTVWGSKLRRGADGTVAIVISTAAAE
jgi:PPOX class probable F420-dependent enzyme